MSGFPQATTVFAFRQGWKEGGDAGKLGPHETQVFPQELQLALRLETTVQIRGEKAREGNARALPTPRREEPGRRSHSRREAGAGH